MKKTIVLFGTALAMATAAQAQVKPCSTDENRARVVQQHPEIQQLEASLEAEIQHKIETQGLHQFMAKGTGLADSVYHVPVVFHVIHDYGEEDVTDNEIFEVVNDMNRMYSRSNPDSVGIIAPYAGNIPTTNIPYRGKANIHFHLATKDPNGNPTIGITRTRSFYANNGGENSKLRDWPSNMYINIWLIHTFSGSHTGAAAYAYQPPTAQYYPYDDGVIEIVQPSTGNPLNNDHTISHEVGHEFNLAHPWGNTNNPQVARGDDNVDDTPPTMGHYSPSGCVPVNLYDVACASGYSKNYTAAQSTALFGDPSHLVVNYPDTVNSQNVMDYTYCSKMFTYGQVLRMRTALTSSTAGRNNLIATQNLINTGVMNANGTFNNLPNLAPIADFYPTNANYLARPFTCADGITTSYFKNFSYQDTIASSAWTFGNGANTPTLNTLDAAGVTFTVPGWVHASLTVTGNNGSGTGTVTKDSVLYAADPAGVNPVGYTMSFVPGADLNKWPIFNYYNNSYKWETVTSAGYDDSKSMRFTNHDPRTTGNNAQDTLTPSGTYSDFYSCGYDLTNVPGDANLTFAYAGAYRTNNTSEMNDSFRIAYSVNCGGSWTTFATIKNADIGNNGYIASDFTPTSQSQWKWYAAAIPPFIPGGGYDKVFFRFRYIVGTNNTTDMLGTGNNFYIDNIGINDYALGVTTAQLEAQGIVLSPNPTSGAATVTIRGGDNSTALVHVTDITGKVIYSTQVSLNATATKVQIPAERIAVKGLYMVEVITNGRTMTQKLSVY